MRIRKRQVPLPFSSLSPLPLSDPCFAGSPAVQHFFADANGPLPGLSPPPLSASLFDPPPPDRPIKPDHDDDVPQGCSLTPICPALKQDGDREKRDVDRRNDSREKSLLGAELGAPSSIQDEKAFPLKKRSWGNLEVVNLSNNKKYVETEDNEHGDQKEGGNCSASSVKKRGRGGALMEGSRCSRVNGRGWRCCQPTLVGYSLCEHHLGKGRLLSMTNVRVGATQKKEKRTSVMAADHHAETMHGSHEDAEGITKPLKRRSSMKLGTVKARSISSLLDETTAAKGVSVLSEKNKQEN